MKIRSILTFLPGLLCPITAGCGSGEGYTLGGVRGTVTFKGVPVRSGFIIFVPDGTKQTAGPQGMSKIADDGTYVLSSKVADDGAVVGFHKVGIMATDPKPIVEVPEDQAPKDIMVAKGQQARRPPPRKSLGPTFTDRGGNVYRVLTPEKLRSPETSGISVEVGRGSNVINFNVKEDGEVEVVKS
jgi:hypothetical protein